MMVRCARLTGASGAVWHKVSARAPAAVARAVCGDGDFNRRSILDGVAELAAARRGVSVRGSPPTLVLHLVRGASRCTAAAVEAMGVQLQSPGLVDCCCCEVCRQEGGDGGASVEVVVGRVEEEGAGAVLLDVTAMVAWCSELTNAAVPDKRFAGQRMREMAAAERLEAALPILRAAIGDARRLTTAAALAAFDHIVQTIAGPNEAARAEALRATVEVVDAAPSPRLAALERTAKVRDRSIATFGAGDALRVPVVSANSGFVRAAAEQGVVVDAVLHPARALSETSRVLG